MISEAKDCNRRRAHLVPGPPTKSSLPLKMDEFEERFLLKYASMLRQSDLFLTHCHREDSLPVVYSQAFHLEQAREPDGFLRFGNVLNAPYWCDPQLENPLVNHCTLYNYRFYEIMLGEGGGRNSI